MIRVKRSNDRAEVLIHGYIIDDPDATWLARNEDGTVGYCWPDALKKELDALDGLPIDLHVASDGGDVAAGICIYNMLKSHKGGVTAYVDSWAASIASVIVFAADKIVMPKNTFLMIHNPQGGAYGEADYLQAVATWLGKLKDMIANVYNDNSGEGYDLDYFKEKMNAETWYTALEASEVFSKVELADANDIEAVAVFSDLKTAPDAINAHIRAEKQAKEKETAETVAKLSKLLQEAYNYEKAD